MNSGQQCQWFVLCDREATQEVDHPILGGVPTCDRCAERTGKPAKAVASSG